MAGRYYVHLTLAVLVTGFVTSCNSGQRTDPVATGGHNVPPSLLQIDQTAEQIVPAASEGDWPRVYAYTQNITDAWTRFRSTVGQPPQPPIAYPASMLTGRFEQALNALQDAVAQRQTNETMRAANDVSEAAVSLFEFYRPAVPSDLRRVELLERRVMIELAQSTNDYDTVSDTLERAITTWQKTEAVVQPHAGDKAVQAVGQELDQQKAAVGTHDRDVLTASIERTLKLIDGIQALY